MNHVLEIDFKERHTVEIPLTDTLSMFAHECKLCGERFRSTTGKPQRCTGCGKRGWRGYSKWEAAAIEGRASGNKN